MGRYSRICVAGKPDSQQFRAAIRSSAIAATSTFNITVTDSEVPPASLTKNFSLTMSSAKQQAALLNGSYAFLFSGFNVKRRCHPGGQLHCRWKRKYHKWSGGT